MSAEKAIHHILSNASGVTDIVGQRIKPIAEHQAQALPYITYQTLIGTPAEDSQGSAGGTGAVIQINAYAATYESARDIIEQVRLAAQGQQGTFNGVNAAVRVDSGPQDLQQTPGAATEVPVFARSIDLAVMFLEAIPS
jgi:hypothetical protein